MLFYQDLVKSLGNFQQKFNSTTNSIFNHYNSVRSGRMIYFRENSIGADMRSLLTRSVSRKNHPCNDVGFLEKCGPRHPRKFRTSNILSLPFKYMSFEWKRWREKWPLPYPIFLEEFAVSCPYTTQLAMIYYYGIRFSSQGLSNTNWLLSTHELTVARKNYICIGCKFCWGKWYGQWAVVPS